MPSEILFLQVFPPTFFLPEDVFQVEEVCSLFLFDLIFENVRIVLMRLG